MGLLFLILIAGLITTVAFVFRRSGPATRKWLTVALSTGAILALGAVALATWMVTHTPPEIGEKLNSVEWLDSRASDISYFRANNLSGVFYYEFRITEPDFIALAQERNWPLAGLSAEHTVIRYGWFLPESDSRNKTASVVRVNTGWIHQDRRPNGGGITVVYDSSANRAYVSRSSR